jgi:hypothetical protein
MRLHLYRDEAARKAVADIFYLVGLIQNTYFSTPVSPLDGKGGWMRALRNFIIFVVLVVIAFGAGYGLGYWKLQSAEKEWASARENAVEDRHLEKELAKARTRETLREMSDILSQVVADLSEKNFGLR